MKRLKFGCKFPSKWLSFQSQSTTRENGEQRGVGGVKNAAFARAALARPGPETAPTLGEWAKKIPTDEGWDFGYWWSWGDSNPRPRTFHAQFYMLSGLI